jgi:hypothetical protein
MLPTMRKDPEILFNVEPSAKLSMERAATMLWDYCSTYNM